MPICNVKQKPKKMEITAVKRFEIAQSRSENELILSLKNIFSIINGL
jgi:hypothetical protein